MLEFKKLINADGSWQAFQNDWKTQCEKYDEDFDYYIKGPIHTVQDLADDTKKDAAIYALFDGTSYPAMCQLNVAGLPGYDGKVLRARMIYLSPDYDVGDYSVDQYSQIIAQLLMEIIELSKGAMLSKHIKFHLRSITDRMIFNALSICIRDESMFKDIQMKGSWLYITKN
jgi:hypothetical protein